MANMLYLGLVASQLITLVGYVVVTAGAALLQQKANSLTLFDGLQGQDLTDTIAVYENVFQSTTYIIPYPQRPQYQFQYQWWIIQFELFIFLLTAACTVFPSLAPRLRRPALTLLASALVLVMDNINAVFYLLRLDLAKTVFDGYRIQVTQAGLIIVAIANGLTIFTLGLYEPEQGSRDADVYVDKAGPNKA